MEPITISKTNYLPQGLSYEELRKEGISLLQSLASEQWTDYNIHDPGVTILEHICYALTEIAYKTNRDIREIIAPAINKKESGHTFFPAHEILSSQPVTINDYRKLVIDRFRENITNVWIVPDPGKTNIDGCYMIYIRLCDELYNKKGEMSQLSGEVLSYLNANRNIAEFFIGVKIVEALRVNISADIEIDSKENENKLLAMISYKLANALSPRTSARAFYQLRQDGLTNEDIFEGPLTLNGFIGESDLLPAATTLSVSTLLKQISGISGIKEVVRFSITIDGNPVTQQRMVAGDKTLLLATNEDGMPDIHLYKSGVPMSINVIRFEKQHRLLSSGERQAYNNPGELRKQFDLPPAFQPDIESYYSIQHDFPPNYGLGRPASEYNFDVTRLAQVKQLKGYLLLFEQFIANFQSQLANAHQLLSTNITREKKTYFYQSITTIPGLNELVDNESLNAHLQGIFVAKDNYADRQNDMLNHLLARFGEQFPGHMYDLLNPYFSEEKIQEKKLAGKTQFLQHIVALSSTRMKAPVYSNSIGEMSPIQERLFLQLGLIPAFDKLVGVWYREFGLQSVAPGDTAKTASDSRRSNKNDLVSLKKQDAVFASYDFSAGEKFIVPALLKRWGILQTADFFVGGTRFENFYYRHHGNDHSQHFELFYKSPVDKSTHLVANFSDYYVLLYEVRKLVHFMRSVNIATERLHIIEHVLLVQADTALIPASFYSSSVSIVLPAWTTRFGNAEFRSRAMPIILQNLPVHLQVNVLWLNFSNYTKFESLYTEFCKSLAETYTGSHIEAKRNLAHFLYHKELMDE